MFTEVASSGSPATPIAFRADDAGACPGITAGILRAVREGVARNVSLMVPPPGFAAAALAFRGIGPDVALGLHVTLNCEWPGVRWRALAPPALVPALARADGILRHATPADLHAAAVPVEQMLREVRCQLAALRAAGLEPSYLDEHMGVGWVRDGALRSALLELCAQEGLVHADTLPRCDDPRPATTREDWSLGLLAGSAPGSVLITHPAEPSPDLRALAGREGEAVAAERAHELAMLCSSRLRLACLPGGPLRSVTMREAARLQRQALTR